MSKAVRWILASAILVAVIIWVSIDVGWHNVMDAWRDVPPLTILVMGIITISSYLLRAARFYLYFGHSAGHPFLSYTRISFLHNAFNNFLPMRLGEASFPLLMKQQFGYPLLQTSAGLVWIRLLDLHWLLVLLSLVACVQFGTVWLATTGALLAAPLLLLWQRDNLIRLLPQRRQEQLQGLRHYAPANRWMLIKLYGITITVWCSKLLAFTVIMLSFLDIPVAQGVLAVISADLSSVLPIHGLAGSGTFEAAMLMALLPLGVARSDVLLAAVNVHLYLLLTTLLVVPLALAIPSHRENR